MAEAPEQVVRRVQEALGCLMVPNSLGTTTYCRKHSAGLPDCPVATRAADAAFAASLEWAAERVLDERMSIPPIGDPYRGDVRIQRSTLNTAASRLRRLAGTEMEATK